MPFETIKIEKLRPPAELLEPCRVPDLDTLETTGDIERVAGEAIASLATCNDDKAAIKSWSEEE